MPVSSRSQKTLPALAWLWHTFIIINNIITKHNNVDAILILSAQSEEPCLISQQCVLIASQAAGIAISFNEYIASLDMAKLMARETTSVEIQHCLQKCGMEESCYGNKSVMRMKSYNVYIITTCMSLRSWHDHAHPTMTHEYSAWHISQSTSRICLPYSKTVLLGSPLLRRRYFSDQSASASACVLAFTCTNAHL